MRRLLLLTLLPTAFATGALAQTADPHAGHSMPAEPAADPHAAHQASPVPAPIADPHAGHAMPTPAASADPHAGHMMTPPVETAPADPHAGHDMSSMASAEAPMTGADQPVGDVPPPAAPTDNAADGVYEAAAMSRARDILEDEHGGATISKVMANIAEYRAGPNGGGYRWDLEAWYGGDINRLVLKSEGEGGGEDDLEAAEIQALYSRAVARYTDVQVGIRHDFEPGPSRTYATVGFETLFPYWFEAEGALFLSQEGDLSGRLEGSYDLQLTQRWVLQPQAELSVSAQDVPELAIGSGLTDAELGLRLRYEIRREFAPYVGVTYERSLGATADIARAAGEDVEDTSFVVGVRAWF